MKRVWINPLYDIMSQEVAEIKGALHPMHWGEIGDRRKIVGIHNKYSTR